ncbi:MAG: DNA repair protein RecN, partial [Gammaproteobacteria bacterium]|nr:DNA repair protein RecN [Gammaproteobacteria bacterium]
MLRSLQVRNFAIVDEAEIDFASGMTVLTGETGAGKSILVDALGLVLGERGGTGLVRSGTQRAEFSADFDIGRLENVRTWLRDNALDMDDDCVLRRVINSDGRSRAFINSTAVPLQSLKALGEMLLDIHGQHFHQSLSRRDVQRDLLDHFGKLLGQRDKTAAAFANWQSLAREYDELRAANADRSSRLELLTFQCQELESLAIADGEIAELKAEREILRNSGKLADNIGSALQVLSDNESANANSMIAEALRSVEALADLDVRLAPVVELLRDADIQLGEATDELRRYAASLDMDPLRAEEVEDRLDAIRSVARKHHVEPENLPRFAAELEQQRSSLEQAEERGAQIEQATEAAFAVYAKAARSLSKSRKSAASKLSQQVTAAMADLGMPGGRFVVRAEAHDAAAGKASGLDDIDYLITANPGQE